MRWRHPKKAARPGRRRLRLAVIAAALIATAAAGCSSGGGGATSGGTPVSGGTLKFAVDTEPTCLDPGYNALDVVAVIDRNIFDSLVYEAPDHTFHPWLAQSWTVSPDGRTYTFTLRPGVTFQDGTPLNAAAVKATFDHAVDPATKSLYAAGLLGRYTGATVVNDQTVAVNLSQPDDSLLQAISTPYLGIQSPASLAAGKNPCLNPVGSGPFSLTSWTKNQSLSLKKNPSYTWGPSGVGPHTGPAYLDGITIDFLEEDSARVGALTSNQVDVAGGVPPVDVKTVKGSGLQLLSQQAPGGVYAMYLNTTNGPTADERVRTALLRGIDYTSIINSVYFGQYQRAWSVLGPTTVDYDSQLASASGYDPTLANQLLDQAGWTGRNAQGYRTKNGQELTISWPYPSQYVREQRDVLGQAIQAAAKQLGINLDFVGQDAGTYANETTHGAPSVGIVAISSERDDPGILRTLFGSTETTANGGFNIFDLNDPTLDGWLDDGATNPSTAARATDYTDAQAYIIQHALAVPVYVPVYLLGANNNVHGLGFDDDADPVFYNTWLTGS